MEKKVETKTQNSSIPFLIIGIVLLVAIIGGWWFYQSSRKPATGTNANRAANSANAQRTPQIPANAPVGAQPANILGSPTASVTIEEFADFQCPTCASVHTIMKNVQAAYGSRIKFVYRHFPLTTIHKNAYDASVAAEAAGQQGRFWDMQNQLFVNQQAWSNAADARTLFEGYAEKIGLDVEKFKTDMLGLATKSRVDADIQRARALNVNSTPTIYINGVSLPFEQMNINSIRQIIDAELQKAGSQNQTGAPTAPAAATNSNPAANTANSAANSSSNK